MKRLTLAVLIVLFFAPLVFAQEGKEMVTLRRDFMQERVIRITAELELMKVKFREGQEILKACQKELETLNASVKTFEEAKQ